MDQLSFFDFDCFVVKEDKHCFMCPHPAIKTSPRFIDVFCVHCTRYGGD